MSEQFKVQNNPLISLMNYFFKKIKNQTRKMFSLLSGHFPELCKKLKQIFSKESKKEKSYSPIKLKESWKSREFLGLQNQEVNSNNCILWRLRNLNSFLSHSDQYIINCLLKPNFKTNSKNYCLFLPLFFSFLLHTLSLFYNLVKLY